MVLELVSGERALYVFACNRSWTGVRLGRVQRDAGVCECGGAPRRAAEAERSHTARGQLIANALARVPRYSLYLGVLHSY